MSRNESYGQPQSLSGASHRKPRKRSPLTRVVAAGGAVVSIGAAYEVTAPTVHALSIVFRSPNANGTANEVRINVLQGNVFDPQLGLLAPNVSNNSTGVNGTTTTANNPLVDNLVFDNPITRFLSALLNAEIVIGGAAAGPISNSTQISFLSFNIFNPQASLFGGNLSHNATNTNIATGYGNNTNTSVTSIPSLWGSWFGGMTGNGNVNQLAFLSGNIFNPQWSIFGPNVSNNTAITNSAVDNGNYSQTSVVQGGGLLGAVLRFLGGGMTGNGNTTQTAVGTSNITNPQVSIGGSNQSNNTAVTNEALGNGNSSQTSVGGSGSVISTGTTGNGNTTQTAVNSSNIENTQVSIGDIGMSTRPDQLSAAHSGGQVTTTSTTPTSSSVSPLGASSLSTTSSGSSTPESGGSSTGSGGTTGTSGSGGTTGSGATTGTSATSGSAGSGGTSGSGGSSGGSGGSGSE
jgi:hypothetical protein